MKRSIWFFAFAAIVLPVLPAGASHQAGHGTPQGPAKVRFAPGFLASGAATLGHDLVDHEWDHQAGFAAFPIAGFGGDPSTTRHHTPVIFVHGNNVDHGDWYPVRDAFKAAGWNDQELWALSYNGLGGNNGTALFTANPERDAEHTEMAWDGQTRVTSNEVNVDDLHDFVLAVRTYTGSTQFSIVSHSLGVTLARRMLKKYPALRGDLVAFVGIAGGNHGTTFCPPGSEGIVVSCDEIAAGTPWLDALNGPGNSDETYPPARWLTIYDGTGLGDPAYVGPTYAQSPRLERALNCEFPLTYHNDLRLDPGIVSFYRSFLEGEATECR